MGTGVGVDIFTVTVAKVKEVEDTASCEVHACVCARVCMHAQAHVYFDGSLVFHFLSINKPLAHPALVLVHSLHPEAEF